MSGEPEGNTVACDISPVRQRLCGVVDPMGESIVGPITRKDIRSFFDKVGHDHLESSCGIGSEMNVHGPARLARSPGSVSGTG